MKSTRYSVVLCIFLAVAVVSAQEFRATLTGRVLDPSDSPVPSASVVVKNEGSGATHTAKTDPRGNYTVALLQS